MSNLDKGKILSEKDTKIDIKEKEDIKFPYLKKGCGKLASQYHGETQFAKERKLKIIKEQEEREKEGW